LSRYNKKLAADTPSCWSELIKTISTRAEEMKDIIINYVFVIPKVISFGPKLITVINQNKININEKIINKTELNHVMDPFYEAKKRQQISFPDRKLVQFDSGKLQSLYVLLSTLKKGGHKCLIFTQMSKMLDILEVILSVYLSI
jgi:SNF2 family DNA or RNA helicase